MILLASQSPRRKQLLGQYISSSFLTYVPSIDEEASNHLVSPVLIVRDISKRKLLSIPKEYDEYTSISADTIVVFNDEILGKPKDENDAKKILRKLSNNTHEVITAFSIKKGEKIVTHHVVSKVTFNDLSDELIDAYVASKSPLDKAGAYGIQDNDKFNIVKSYTGSYTNIVGFPIDEIKEVLNSL